MPIISFKNSDVHKRGIWFAAAALVAAVSAPSFIDRSIFNQPIIHIVPILVLSGFWVYFLQRGRLFTLADEVVDEGDHLKVRRGRTEVIVPFSDIRSAEVNSEYRLHRITLHLRERTKLGTRIDFWPQARSWGDLFATQLVASDMNDRAKHAVGGTVN